MGKVIVEQRKGVNIQSGRGDWAKILAEVPGHGIEIGVANWQIHQVSIRDRYQTQSHEKVVLELEELTDMGFRGEKIGRAHV